VVEYLCQSYLSYNLFNRDVISKKRSSPQGIVRPPIRWSYPNSFSAWVSNSWNEVEVLSPVCLPAPVTLDKNTSHQSMYATVSIPHPVTTRYARSTSDKLPSIQILVHASKPSLHSAAALKSVHILSKFWGDEVEEVMEDTLSHDKRREVEEDNDEAIVSDFDQHCPSLGVLG